MTIARRAWQHRAMIDTVISPLVMQAPATTAWAAGWYRLRVELRTPEQPAIRKQAALDAELCDGSTLTLDRFEWNERLREDLIVQLPGPTATLRLAPGQSLPDLKLATFRLDPVHRLTAFRRALACKWRLLRNYQCVGPVLYRGWRLLLQGRLAEFRERIFRGLSDSRTMRIEVKQAIEANAAWWRRRALSSDELAALHREIAALPAPRPMLVLIPTDRTRHDHARHAALSV
ncbi:MAG: hypothetical protein ACRCZF_15750, partial [Gemmataceae bacterium]